MDDPKLQLARELYKRITTAGPFVTTVSGDGLPYVKLEFNYLTDAHAFVDLLFALRPLLKDEP